MTTRFIPVSLAVPAHLDHLTDTELLATMNGQLVRANPQYNVRDQPFMVHLLSPEQFVTKQNDRLEAKEAGRKLRESPAKAAKAAKEKAARAKRRDRRASLPASRRASKAVR